MNIMTKNKLNIYGPINTMGYGISSYNIWKNLREKLHICLFPIANIDLESHWLKQNIVEDIKNQMSYDKTAPCLKIWHANDMILKPYSTGPYACYTFFELNKITKQESIGYDILDIIFVPSKWAKNILIDNGVQTNKICVAPSGVDVSVFNHKDYNHILEDRDKDKYIFLNIGKWEMRKGHDMLVHMFNQAFDKKDNVELWMLNTNPFLSKTENLQWANLYKNSPLGEKIKIFPRLPTQKDIAKVIKLSDCGIYPSRAEGWNNEVIETMAMNKPVITTNYSAHTEYCDDTNSYLVEVTNKEIANDGKFFQNFDGEWASLDNLFDDFIDKMRYVYKNQIRENVKGIETANTFNWSETANIINKKLYA